MRCMQVDNLAVHNPLLAQLKEGPTIKLVIAWANDKLEGFVR